MVLSPRLWSDLPKPGLSIEKASQNGSKSLVGRIAAGCFVRKWLRRTPCIKVISGDGDADQSGTLTARRNMRR
jgi:hypothetical protein